MQRMDRPYVIPLVLVVIALSFVVVTKWMQLGASAGTGLRALPV